jgi:hypothetical protein
MIRCTDIGQMRVRVKVGAALALTGHVLDGKAETSV